jgi:hypothetical protein
MCLDAMLLIESCIYFTPKLTWVKGIDGRRLEWQKQMEEYYNCQWAQEDVKTSYNLLIIIFYL